MGKSSRFAALLAALAANTPAQQTASLTGTVTNSVTGAPVVRAHVTIRGAKNFGALTNAEGKFSIAGIDPGGYVYKAERVGFTTDNPGGAKFVTLHEGHSLLDLKLSPLGAIGGRVVNTDGEPVQLVTVLVEGMFGGQSTTTDSKGQYRVGDLIPGKYRIKVRPNLQDSPPEIRSDGSKEVHYRSTYFPGVAESNAAARITVAPGSETSGIDIPLLTTPIVKVSGKILDIPTGTKEVSVEVAEVPGSCCSWAKVNKDDGSFFIWGLDPGKYKLRAGPRGDENVQSAAVELDLGTTSIEHVELRMVPPFEISGHIEFEDGRARESSKGVGNGAAKATDRMVYLATRDDSRRGEVALADDDTFKLEKAQPGMYHATVSLGHTFVKSVRLGSKESDDETLDLQNGLGGQVTLVVSAAWSEISGTVSNADGPMNGAHVLLIQGGISRVQQCDANGHYVAKDLRPGMYQLLAGDERIGELWQDDDALEDYKEVVATVQVHAGEKVTQDLKAIPGGK